MKPGKAKAAAPQVPHWYECRRCARSGRPTGVWFAGYVGEVLCESCRWDGVREIMISSTRREETPPVDKPPEKM